MRSQEELTIRYCILLAKDNNLDENVIGKIIEHDHMNIDIIKPMSERMRKEALHERERPYNNCLCTRGHTYSYREIPNENIYYLHVVILNKLKKIFTIQDDSKCYFCMCYHIFFQ